MPAEPGDARGRLQGTAQVNPDGMTRFLSDAWTVLRRALASARDDGVPTTAQALAYSLFLSIPATMLVLLGVFSLAADVDTIERLVDRAETVIPGEAATLLRDSLERSAEATSTGIVVTALGLTLALWTTTSAATTLMKGLNLTFGSEDRRGFAHTRLAALVIVVLLALGAALVLGLLVLGPHLQGWIGDAIGAPRATGWVWWIAQWPILIAGLLFAFAVVLYLGPDAEQRWQHVVPGAAAAVIVWLAASGAFALYAANFGSYEKSWGTLTAVVVTLVWLWLTSAALLLGGEINAEVQRLMRERRTARPDVAAAA